MIAVAAVPKRLASRLPHGLLPVATGMGVSGGSAYLFLIIAARTLGPARYAPFAAFWSLVMLVGPGTYSALERDTARRLAVARDPDGSPVVRYAALVGASFTVVLLVLAVAFGGTLSRALDGNHLLIGVLLVSLPLYCAEYLLLGQAIGNVALARYGVIIGSEGLLRLVGGAALVVVGVASIGSLGAAVVTGTGLAAAIGLVLLRHEARRGRATTLRAVAVSCSWQVTSILLLNILTNAGPLLVKVLATRADQRLAAPFLSALVLVRVPLLAWTSAGPSLLGRMSALVDGGPAGELRRYLRRVSLAIAAVGAGSVLVGGGLGPTILRLAFGSGFVLARRDIILLAVLVTALIACATLSLVLTALGREHAMAGSLALGVAAMAALVAVIPPLLERVELGLLGGAVVAAGAMLLMARRSMGATSTGP